MKEQLSNDFHASIHVLLNIDKICLSYRYYPYTYRTLAFFILLYIHYNISV